ncbi:spore protease YyaC [Cohnella endophytica]|uniref:Spore protease YyaC n=1 Tax=Cohnella endophytica TaxID=2419778 RepID=A0A494XU37_9BACL|nr:spore protease YyaC [Cohnella endophytica]RKP54090.1 spore protease YyaC [Cohnella endophytica]
MSSHPESPLKILYTEPSATIRLTNRLSGQIKALPPGKRIVVVCIGTDRSTGDSLGPLTGSLLSKYRSSLFELYGTLEHPVHAMNLDDTLAKISRDCDDPYVIAIDACLGTVSGIGTVFVGDGPLRPGAGVNKQLSPVGNIHVSGIVNIGGLLGYHVLQNTRLHLVMSMANLISRSLFVAITLASNIKEEAPSLNRGAL